MVLKKTTVEEFDEAGKLRKRTVTEEDYEQLRLVPAYPALPLYPYPAPPAIIPYTPPIPNPYAPWDPPQPVIITCREGNSCVAPGNVQQMVSNAGQCTVASSMVH